MNTSRSNRESIIRIEGEIKLLKAEIQTYEGMISAIKHSIDCKCD